MSLTIQQVVLDAYRTACDRGWHAEDEAPPSALRCIAWLGLVCSEAAEAMEDIREGRTALTVSAVGKPEGLPSELADIVIRVADIAGVLGVDLEEALRLKLAYNTTRAHRHGGKAL